uniref:uncharacterized protein LOC113474374 n=1 Tax=Ciona intestinalis TaxID=7719 RepID=UPI000EF52AD1|nr:uncharacterized protein LOC113474374 [Ciona intestinalis]|eukprot:XP_026690939.1 uncharacterized protein LOC113474374 [Ciona intestinalis]
MKRFVCIEFVEGRETAIACREWMLSSTECQWPPSGNIQTLVKQVKRPEADWTTYRCRILCGAGTFERCTKKAHTLKNVGSSEAGSDSDFQTMFSPTQMQTLDHTPGGSYCVKHTVSPSEPIRKRLNTSAPTPEKIRKIQAADQNSNILHLIGCIRTDMSEIQRNVMKLHKKMDNIKEITHAGRSYINFAPANTLEELNQLIHQENNFSALAGVVERDTLRSTIREFVKRFFTKKLALQFSWSGLGEKRRKIKTSFKDHTIYSVLGIQHFLVNTPSEYS